MAIETNAEGEIAQISLVELDDAGKPLNTYLIPAVAPESNVIPAQTRTIELGPLELEPIEMAEPSSKKEARAKKIHG